MRAQTRVNGMPRRQQTCLYFIGTSNNPNFMDDEFEQMLAARYPYCTPQWERGERTRSEHYEFYVQLPFRTETEEMRLGLLGTHVKQTEWPKRTEAYC